MSFMRLSALLALMPLSFVCAAAETPAGAQEAAPANTAVQGAAAAAPATGKPKSNISISGPTSRVSDGLSSSITSRLPKFQPQPPPSATPPEDPALDEATEIEDPEQAPGEDGQPRNKIVRLPKYVVFADKPPIFRERDLNTKKGLSKLAAKRYTSALDRNLLNRYTIPLIGMTPEQRALLMYEADERLENINDVEQDANNAQRAGDKEEADALRRESNRTFMRSGGMDWTMPKE